MEEIVWRVVKLPLTFFDEDSLCRLESLDAFKAVAGRGIVDPLGKPVA